MVALQKLAELRALGFEDPVDALLALAYETDEEGEFSQPVEIRIECLKAAAPFCRPKLAAVVQRNVSEGKSHVEWLEELKGYVEGEERESDGEDGPVVERVTVNGDDPGQLATEPEEQGDGEDAPDQVESIWKPQGR